jgi:predicted ATP-binding protein involved in virulence
MATSNQADYITKIQVSNFDKIQDFELDFKDDFQQFLVFTGDNGVGKTLLLGLIFLALDTQQSIDSRIVDIVLHQNNDELITYSYSRTNSEEAYLNKLLSSNSYQKIAAYGASRLSIQGPDTMERNEYQLQNILVSNAPLRNIEYWLKMKLLSDQKPLVRKVLDLLSSFMPNVSTIDYKTDSKEGVIFQYETLYGFEKIQDLSAGNKGVLALIGDLIIRLWDKQLDVQEIKNLKGIVLIDEIEAHLHPKWQRKFPKLLAETFPNVQFIISTHTPMTILGLPKNSSLIHVGYENQSAKVQQLDLDIQNMTPQQILTSDLFGVESLRSLYNENLEDLNTEESYSKLLENKEVKDRIKEVSKTFKFQKPKE